MDEKKEQPVLQLVAPVYHDDEHVDPAPSYAVLNVTGAQAVTILEHLQTAAAFKAAAPGFFSFSMQDGCADFVESSFELEELTGGEGDYVRVPEGEFLTDEQIEEARGELNLYGHLAEFADDGVRFVCFAEHSGDRFETAWIKPDEFFEAAGGALTDKVVLLSISHHGVDKGAMVDGHGHDEGDSEAEIIRAEVASHFDDLRDSGLVKGPAVDFI